MWCRVRMVVSGLLLMVVLDAGVGVGVGVRAAGTSMINLVNNGYEGVVIGISPQVIESQGPAIITAIKQMIKEASGHMFVATRRRAFLRQVKVLIPQSWSNTTIDQVATTESFMKSDIRVDLPHAIYKNQPYTEQPGECGEPGEYIHLTPEYLTQRKFSLWWGPP
ncbi:hypothetical protein OTU49_006374, partial [Cherax quadricarinatus]